MPPVGGPAVATESLCQRPCGGGAQFPIELLRVLEPCLVVAWRGLDHKGGRKTLPFHDQNGIAVQIVHQTEIVLPMGTDIDVSAIPVLVAQPRNGPKQCVCIPRARQHDRLSVGRVRLE